MAWKRRLTGAARSRIFSASLLATSALSSITSQALAQAASDEIIVTATKRSENIQDVPLSIQALGEVTLDQHNITSFDGYANLLPSVSYQSFGPGQAQVFFRGVSSAGDGLHIGSAPTSSTYLDDTPVTTIANSVDLHLYDISRVEALSGPQGTLFGASSLSGVLRIITNKPDPSGFSGGYNFEINKYDAGEPGALAEAFFNIPIGGKAALRVVGFYKRDGGYIDNTPATRTYGLGDGDPTTEVTIDNAALVADDINNVDTFGGRVALGIDLFENWTSTTSLIGQHQEVDGPFLFDPTVGDLEVHDFQPTHNQDDWWMISQTIQGKIADFDVVYSGSYFSRGVDSIADYSYYTVAYDYYTQFTDADGNFLDPSQTAKLGDDYKKQSQELRFNSPADMRLRGTFGLFYQTQIDDVAADYGIVGAGAPGVTDPYPDFGTFGFGDDVFFTRVKRKDVDKAVFGEVSFDITDKLTLTGGLRWFETENSIYGFSGTLGNATSPGCVATSRTDVPCINIDKTFKEDGKTYKASLQYKVDDDRMVYATYSTGFRPGGNNRRVGVLPYLSDTIDNYEIGWKTQWFDRNLRFNGAIFKQIWENLQFGLPGPNGVTSTYNAGSAEVLGAETDVSWQINQLTLSGSATYIHSELTSDFCQIDPTGNPFCAPGEVPAVSSGTRLPIQPRFKGTATARYDFTLGSLKPFVQATVLHQTGTRTFLLDVDAAAVGPTKGFTTLNLSSGLDFKGASWEFYVNNVTDERGVLSRNSVCTPGLCGVYARSYPVQPLIFGLRVGRRF
jgi:iron complex outermembrane recepter protein